MEELLINYLFQHLPKKRTKEKKGQCALIEAAECSISVKKLYQHVTG